MWWCFLEPPVCSWSDRQHPPSHTQHPPSHSQHPSSQTPLHQFRAAVMPTSLFPALQEQWTAIGIPGEKPRERVFMLWLFKKICQGSSCLHLSMHSFPDTPLCQDLFQLLIKLKAHSAFRVSYSMFNPKAANFNLFQCCKVFGGDHH